MTAVFEERVVATAVARGLDAVRDWPNPAGDGFCSAEKYARMAQDFRRSAWKHLEEGDLPQASNKAWGVVAGTVKAISLHHGRVIHSHRGILQVVEELADLPLNAGDEELHDWIRNAFRGARSLHSNFYEDRDSEGDIRSGLRLCERLSARFYELFWREGAAC